MEKTPQAKRGGIHHLSYGYENHVIVPLFKIICEPSQQEIHFAPIRGAEREALPW